MYLITRPGLVLLALLLSKGVSAQDALYNAIITDDRKEVSEFLAAGGDPRAKIEGRSPWGNTVMVYPLELAIVYRHDEMAAELIEAGASLAPSESMGDLLEVSADLGLTSTVSAILARKPDALDVGNPHNHALSAASSAGWLDVVRVLLEHGEKHSTQWNDRLFYAFLSAAGTGSEDIARLVVSAGLDVTQPAVLHAAVQACNAGLVRDLIQMGAPIDTEFEGLTVVERVASRMNRNFGEGTGRLILQELVDNGADACSLTDKIGGYSKIAVRSIRMAAPKCDWPEPAEQKD